MARDNVEKFLVEVENNEEVQARLVSLGKAYKGDKKDIDEIIRSNILPVASELGYLFTEEEYKLYLSEQTADNRKLSEDELDKVVGGVEDVSVSGSSVGGDVTVIDQSQKTYYNNYFIFPGADEDAMKGLFK